MPSYDPGPLLSRLGVLRVGMRELREEAEATGPAVEEAVRRTTTAVEQHSNTFKVVEQQLEVFNRQQATAITQLGEVEAAATNTSSKVSAQAEEVARKVADTAEQVEAAGARVRHEMAETAQAAELAGDTAKSHLDEVLESVGAAGGKISDLLARFDVIQEPLVGGLRYLIDLSDQGQQILVKVRDELAQLRREVDSGALDLGGILERLGELQTSYAKRILEAVGRLKEGGTAAIQELQRLLSEAQRIPDSATAVLAEALSDQLDDSRRRGDL